MKKLLVILYLIFISVYSKELTSCTYEGSVSESLTYEDCKSLQTDDGIQCCVAVLSFYGKNQFFCSQFNESVTQNDIDKIMKEDYIDRYAENVPGLAVRARASCLGDIDPFESKRCSIEETQNNIDFGNCTNFVKDEENDYCCLFSGKVDKENVKFCKELDKDEVSDIDKTTEELRRKSEMNDIEYISCFIPDDETTSQFYFNFNLLMVVCFLLFSF